MTALSGMVLEQDRVMASAINQGRPVLLYSNPSHYVPDSRAGLADLLRPFWKSGSFTDEQRKAMYGLSEADISVTSDASKADIAVLPMAWNFYLGRQELQRAVDFIRHARERHLPVLSYVYGDQGVTVPPGFDDVWVVRASGCRSKKRDRQIASPVFFNDPISTFPQLSSCNPDPNRPRPLVGFCGQASASVPQLALHVLQQCWHNLGYFGRWRIEEPQPLYPSALLRQRALHLLSGSSLVDTRFIIRKKYRAGATDEASRQRTTEEFYKNIALTDYTLCIRGGGNFSKRFYETLALGKIPVLVDTDCLLPFEPELDWERYVVRIPQREIATLPRRLVEHFSDLRQQGLTKLGCACRRLWKERLTFGGFQYYVAQFLAKPPGCSLG